MISPEVGLSSSPVTEGKRQIIPGRRVEEDVTSSAGTCRPPWFSWLHPVLLICSSEKPAGLTFSSEDWHSFTPPKSPKPGKLARANLKGHVIHCMVGCGKDLLGSRLLIYKNKLEACFSCLLVEEAFLIYVPASFASEMKTSVAKWWGSGWYEPNRCTSENETSILDLLSSFPSVVTLSGWWMCFSFVILHWIYF